MSNAEKISQALEVATYAHNGQTRKVSGEPFIIHPIAVMRNCAEVTDDPDTLAAALLHDVIEDVPENVYNRRDMLRDFGQHVTGIVLGVTEDKTIKDWWTRKQNYLDGIVNAEYPESRIVCAADKIHNASSMLDDYQLIGDDLWGHFKTGKDGQRWWYPAVQEVLQSTIPDNHLVKRLGNKVANLLIVLG